MISETTRIKDLLSLGKQTGEIAYLPIVTNGGDDIVYLDAFAGKIPLGIVGIKNTGEMENVTLAAGYTVTAANSNDTLLCGKGGLATIQAETGFNIAICLTGKGTSLKWNTGTYTEVVIVYIKGAVSSDKTELIIRTKAATNSYRSSRFLRNNPVCVFYENQILERNQWAIDGDELTLSGGLAIEEGKQIVVLFAARNILSLTTTAGVDTYSDPRIKDAGIDYIIYGASILTANDFEQAGESVKIKPGVDVEGDKQLVFVFFDGDYTPRFKFNTSAGVDTYGSTGLNGAFIAYVIYHKQLLSLEQFTKAASNVTINPGVPVEDNKTLLIFLVQTNVI